MPQITLNIKSQKNTTQVFSIEDLKRRFLFGLNLTFTDDVYDYWIQTAKKEIERSLSIKLDLQIVTENKDYNVYDWMHWSQIRLTYPIIAAITLEGYLGTVQQVQYPSEWLSVRKTSDDETYSRLLHVVPATAVAFTQTAAVFTGFYPNAFSIGGGMTTPEYWTVKYMTGFKKLPIDIQQAIGMLASLYLLTVGNETLANAMGALGTSSKSISLDGLSESVSMYINGQAGIFSARIKQYSDQLFGPNQSGNGLIDRLRDYYGAIIWTTA